MKTYKYSFHLDNKKIKAKQYFSDVVDVLKKDLKVDLFDRKEGFLLILSGKSTGKSYAVFNELFKKIKRGDRCVYMRNTLVEIQQIKAQILNNLANYLERNDLYANDFGVFDKQKNQILKFASVKQVSNFAGNVDGYDFVFFDEFINDKDSYKYYKQFNLFIELLSSIFRNKRVNVFACANPHTTNNVLFNILKVTPDSFNKNDKLVITTQGFDKNKQYITVVQFKNDLFESSATNDNFTNYLSLYNDEQKDKNFNGSDFWEHNNLVVNEQIDTKKMTTLNTIFNIDDCFAEIFTDNKKYYLVSITKKECLLKQNDYQIYTNRLEYINAKGWRDIDESSILYKLIDVAKSGLVIFDSFIVYSFVICEVHISINNLSKPI